MMGEKNFLKRFEINKLLNIAISTAKLHSLRISKINVELRPQLHCFIWGNIGTAKSTILHEIGKGIGIMPIVSLSKANIYGTVDKNTGILNPPTIWDCRNSCLLIDEFSFNTQNHNDLDVINSLLPILENPTIHKRLGFRVNDHEEKDGDLFLKAKNGKLQCKTRFVFIGTSMTDVSTLSSSSNKALISRCLPIPHLPSFEDLEKYSLKELNFFEYKPFKVSEDVVIKEKDYRFLIELLKKKLDNPDRFLRTLGDLCRIFAVLKKHDEELYDLVIHMRT
jgi:hypothetical protein